MEQSDVWEKLLLCYPGLTFIGDKKVKGNIKVNGRWYRLRVMCPNFPQLYDATLEILFPHQIKYTKVLNSSLPAQWSLKDFIENISEIEKEQCKANAIIEDALISKHDRNSDSSPPTTQNIYKEIAAVYAPESYQLLFSDNCDRVRFSKFVHYDQHYLQVELPSLVVSEHSLPDCEFAWDKQLQKCPNLAAMIQQFQKYLEDLQPFYECFRDIDELCYVVQPPAPPSTKSNWRLFVLRDRVYLKLIIADPFAPIASMSIQIIGPTRPVEEFRRMLSEGLHEWDAELDIHKNLLRIFDLCYFPMPPGSGWAGGDNEAVAVAQQFCNICYSYQLDEGEVPLVSCDNPQCTLIYHAACLREWFNTLTNGKDFLSVSFGACPFCKTKLSTSFAALLEN